jgi:glyoxylase-like metal-dependent hydrolase (beta-lactamase superfamily II)
MTLVLDDRALVGDTLLVGSPGRADFYEQGPEELYHSIFDKLLKLQDELVLYPSHFGPKHGLPEAMMTTLGHEKRSDEALSLRNQHDFVRYMTEGWPPKPHGWEAIVAANTRA